MQKINETLREITKSINKSTILSHPLGFLSFKVGYLAEFNGAVRIHYWPNSKREYKEPRWQIHTHTFDLESHVLLGTIKNINYKIDELSGKKFYIYKAFYEKNSTQIKYAGKEVKLSTFKMHDINPGESYSIEKNTFHESVVQESQECLTFVIERNKNTETHPLIAGETILNTAPPEFEYRSANAAGMISTIERYLEIIKK